MAAKTWESDFRYKAIKASIRQLDASYRDDPFRFSGSFCVPLAVKPVVGWTPGKILLIALVLGFILLGLGALLASQAGEDEPIPSTGLLVAAGVSCLSGFGCFLSPLFLDRYIMTWLLGERAANLLARQGTVLCAEISDTDQTKMTVAVDGDDYVLIVADDVDQRLLIEGVAARYQIRSDDVISVTEFSWKTYVGADRRRDIARNRDRSHVSDADPHHAGAIAVLFEEAHQESHSPGLSADTDAGINGLVMATRRAGRSVEFDIAVASDGALPSTSAGYSTGIRCLQNGSGHSGRPD